MEGFIKFGLLAMLLFEKDGNQVGSHEVSQRGFSLKLDLLGAKLYTGQLLQLLGVPITLRQVMRTFLLGELIIMLIHSCMIHSEEDGYLLKQWDGRFQ
jgi:hypothetical protein